MFGMIATGKRSTWDRADNRESRRCRPVFGQQGNRPQTENASRACGETPRLAHEYRRKSRGTGRRIENAIEKVIAESHGLSLVESIPFPQVFLGCFKKSNFHAVHLGVQQSPCPNPEIPTVPIPRGVFGLAVRRDASPVKAVDRPDGTGRPTTLPSSRVCRQWSSGQEAINLHGCHPFRERHSMITVPNAQGKSNRQGHLFQTPWFAL